MNLIQLPLLITVGFLTLLHPHLMEAPAPEDLNLTTFFFFEQDCQPCRLYFDNRTLLLEQELPEYTIHRMDYPISELNSVLHISIEDVLGMSNITRAIVLTKDFKKTPLWNKGLPEEDFYETNDFLIIKDEIICKDYYGVAQ